VRISKHRQHKCGSCDEELFNAKCTATKTLLIHKKSNSLVVKHEGRHNHEAQKEINNHVINLVKNYFKNRPDANRTVATNDLLASAIMNDKNNKDTVEDLLTLYAREDEFKKLRDEARKSLLDSKHGTFSSVNEFLKKYEDNEWGLQNIVHPVKKKHLMMNKSHTAKSVKICLSKMLVKLYFKPQMWEWNFWLRQRKENHMI